jgi:hypothetical protein
MKEIEPVCCIFSPNFGCFAPENWVKIYIFDENSMIFNEKQRKKRGKNLWKNVFAPREKS